MRENLGGSLYTRTNRLATTSRVLLGSFVFASTLVLSLGANVPSSGAASSAFCGTLVTWAKNPPKPAPTSFNTAQYRAWANEYLPLYSKLASEAPNAQTAKILNQVVTILKDYESASTISALQSIVVKNSKEWATDAKALAKAIISCASSFG
jgi:hypothetical protein